MIENIEIRQLSVPALRCMLVYTQAAERQSRPINARSNRNGTASLVQLLSDSMAGSYCSLAYDDLT